jgi:malate/lactate dehydrogenase
MGNILDFMYNSMMMGTVLDINRLEILIYEYFNNKLLYGYHEFGNMLVLIMWAFRIEC